MKYSIIILVALMPIFAYAQNSSSLYIKLEKANSLNEIIEGGSIEILNITPQPIITSNSGRAIIILNQWNLKGGDIINIKATKKGYYPITIEYTIPKILPDRFLEKTISLTEYEPEIIFISGIVTDEENKNLISGAKIEYINADTKQGPYRAFSDENGIFHLKILKADIASDNLRIIVTKDEFRFFDNIYKLGRFENSLQIDIKMTKKKDSEKIYVEEDLYRPFHRDKLPLFIAGEGAGFLSNKSNEGIQYFIGANISALIKPRLLVGVGLGFIQHYYNYEHLTLPNINVVDIITGTRLYFNFFGQYYLFPLYEKRANCFIGVQFSPINHIQSSLGLSLPIFKSHVVELKCSYGMYNIHQELYNFNIYGNSEKLNKMTLINNLNLCGTLRFYIFTQ